MGNSASIAITVAYPTVATDETRWDMNPKNGTFPLTCTVTGYLWRSGVTENQSDSSIVDGETMVLQMQGEAGEWINTGLTMTTAYNSSNGYHGYYTGQIVLPDSMLSPGTYEFHVYYAGNSSKGLQGC